jgi:succinoglycan biosynthesis protein ExoA
MNPTVLVIIPCLNESAHLEGLLEQFSKDPMCTKIVVADGGSTDGSHEIVLKWSSLEPRIVLMDNPKKTQSCGVNAAIKTFGNAHHWIVRVDAHCKYPDGYVSELIDAQARSGATSVVVPMITQGNGGFQSAVALAQNSKLGTGGAAHRNAGKSRFVDHGHHALMLRQAFMDAGGYCEAMVCNEDAELDVRLAALGHQIWLETSLPIIYFPRASPKALWRQYFKYGQGRARNVGRHRLPMKLRQLLPVAVALSVLGLPLALFFPVLATPALLWLSACLIGGIVIARQADQKALFDVSVAASIMHLAWGLGFLHEFVFHRHGVAPIFGFVPINENEFVSSDVASTKDAILHKVE